MLVIIIVVLKVFVSNNNRIVNVYLQVSLAAPHSNNYGIILCPYFCKTKALCVTTIQASVHVACHNATLVGD